MKGIIIGALTGLLALTVVSGAIAERGGHGFFRNIAERLDLNAETSAAIDAVVEETRAEGRALHEDLWTERHALHELLGQDSPDRAEVMTQIEVLGELEIAANKHRTDTMLRIRARLTPEQRAELKSMRGERFEKVAESCRDEIAAFCADTEPGRATGRCLRQNSDQLSETCTDALPDRGHRRGRGRGRF